MEFLGIGCFLFVVVVYALNSARKDKEIFVGGFFSAAVACIVGSVIGVRIFGKFGPEVFGVSLIPSILGATVFVFFLSTLFRHIRLWKARS